VPKWTIFWRRWAFAEVRASVWSGKMIFVNRLVDEVALLVLGRSGVRGLLLEPERRAHGADDLVDRSPFLRAAGEVEAAE